MKCNTHCPTPGGSDFLGTIAMAMSALGWVTVIACYIVVYGVIPMDVFGGWIVKPIVPAWAIVAALAYRAGTLPKLFTFKGRIAHCVAAIAWVNAVAAGIPPQLLVLPVVATAMYAVYRSKQTAAVQPAVAVAQSHQAALPVAETQLALPAGTMSLEDAVKAYEANRKRSRIWRRNV